MDNFKIPEENVEDGGWAQECVPKTNTFCPGLYIMQNTKVVWGGGGR